MSYGTASGMELRMHAQDRSSAAQLCSHSASLSGIDVNHDPSHLGRRKGFAGILIIAPSTAP